MMTFRTICTKDIHKEELHNGMTTRTEFLGALKARGEGQESLCEAATEWRDPDLDNRSHSRDRSWDARDWDTERDDRREQDYDQMSRDRREREEKYRGRTNRDIDDSFGDAMERDLLPDWGDWGEEAEDEMDLNVLPVSEGRLHTFIPGGDHLDNQSQVKQSRRADRHLGHEDQLWPYEEEPLVRLPVDNTMEEWNVVKPDVQTKTIMLSGLPRITRPADVYHLLHGFHHQVRDMQIETSPTGDHEGVAFIDFFTQQHAVRWMEKTQGSVEILKCEVKADYSSLVLQSEQAVHTWQKWATTVPTDTLVFWNVPPFVGGNAIRFQITESGFKPIKVIVMKNNKPGGSGTSKGYGFIEFGSVAEAVELMDFTKGVLDMIEVAILVTYSSGGKKDDKYTAAEHRTETDNKEQVQGAMDDQKEGIVYVSNLAPDVTQQKIMEVFHLAGEVRKVKKDVTTATVRFKKHQDAVQAISMLNGMIVLESKIAVSEEQPEAVKAPVVQKTNMDINLIRTKQCLYDPSAEKYYKKMMLKKCPVAGCSIKKPVDWKSLARHWAEIHTPTKKKFTCPIKDCSIGLTHTETHLRTHLQAEHDVKGDNLDKKMKGAKFYLIQNEKYSDPGNVVLPQLTQVKGLHIKIPKTQCQVEGCSYTYTTMTRMQQHWAKYHRATVKLYSCSLCKGRILGKSLLQEHLHKTHNVDFDDSKAELVEWKNHNFIDPGDVIPFWSLYTEEDGLNHRELEKELGEDFPLVDIPLDELEKDNPNLYELYEWTEQYIHRLEVARKYALSDLQELTCKALEED
ncbi:uncharacterized protein LOC124278577 isoform X2 [Haliotis rubra]|uniref:uncharacterized protein LOC124278577 isoform X2 n=1 Tax=Haliotis rubra TaxID=36100 RepID=UPI001EE5C16E|nr:uncharacterized protein LOC124278577 isoform X2 [Haliotis rubra]XP_046570275.1 uncharacterized protein LOC124278577 isoform X2 [Haliotis rubra]